MKTQHARHARCTTARPALRTTSFISRMTPAIFALAVLCGPVYLRGRRFQSMDWWLDLFCGFGRRRIVVDQEDLVVLNDTRLLLQAQWYANLDSAQTRLTYKGDLRSFMAFTGIVKPEEIRSVTRAHILAWRAGLKKYKLTGATVRRKLASLYDYLCEANAVMHNPVTGKMRLKVQTNEGKTPALNDAQAPVLLDVPPVGTLKGKCDRAILSVRLYHALRREELTKLLVKDSAKSAGECRTGAS